MKDIVSQPKTDFEKNFWLNLRTFFLCDEDEELHESDVFWIKAFGYAVGFGFGLPLLIWLITFIGGVL